jgi:hypothetical protein
VTPTDILPLFLQPVSVIKCFEASKLNQFNYLVIDFVVGLRLFSTDSFQRLFRITVSTDVPGCREGGWWKERAVKREGGEKGGWWIRGRWKERVKRERCWECWFIKWCFNVHIVEGSWLCVVLEVLSKIQVDWEVRYIFVHVIPASLLSQQPGYFNKAGEREKPVKERGWWKERAVKERRRTMIFLIAGQCCSGDSSFAQSFYCLTKYWGVAELVPGIHSKSCCYADYIRYHHLLKNIKDYHFSALSFSIASRWLQWLFRRLLIPGPFQRYCTCPSSLTIFSS